MAIQREVVPTDGELAILHILWLRGPSTVRQVHDALGGRKVRYTTTLKTMQRMADKGLLTRDQSMMTHVYSAAIDRQPTQRRLLRELLDRAFDGSASKLVMQALAERDISADELSEIRNLLKDKGTGDEHTD